MKEGKNNTIMLTIIGIATLLIAVVGATFAYFSAVLTGEETATTVTIESGSIGTVFEGGSVISVQDIYPRADAWATKTFSISSSANAASAVDYSVGLVIDSNTFTADALKYTLTYAYACSNVAYITQAECTANGGTWDLASTAGGTKAAEITVAAGIPTSGTEALGSGTLPSNDGTVDTHTYDLNIFFPDTGGNQNTEQGKVLEAHITISA